MLYTPIEVNEYNFEDVWRKNTQQLEECDQKAKKEGILVGRYISEPYADGQAVYQIIRENKKTVRIKVCTGIGDDWILPYWGEEATIDKNYVIKKLEFRDHLNKVFRK